MSTFAVSLTALLAFAPAPESSINVSVDPRIELMAAIQVLADYDFTRLITRHEFPYKSELKAHFQPHREHQAVVMFSAMAREGFTFDAPVAMVLHLSPPPELEPIASFDETTVRRAGGRERLDEFVRSLRDFARASDFQSFFDEHQPFHARIAEDVREEVAGMDIEMLEEYFGTEQHSYNIILAPLFHPGGFGPRIERADGAYDVYGVVGPQGVADDRPTFGDEDAFRYLIWHEFSHSFVNPVVDAHGEEIDKHSELFGPIRPRMEKQAYGNWRTCVYEHVVRAVTCRFASQASGLEAAIAAMNGEQQRGFIYLPGISAKLAQYEQQRDKYPTFAEFFPQILSVFEDAGSAEMRMAIAAPPEVVKTTPGNGDQDVDPGLREIVVVFNRDMNEGGFSFVQQNAETFPATTGQPFWRTPRECVLPVKLARKQSYWIGVNTGRFTNFRSVTGEPCAPLILEFRTGGE